MWFKKYSKLTLEWIKEHPELIFKIIMLSAFIFFIIAILMFYIKPKFVMQSFNFFMIFEIILLQVLIFSSQMFGHFFTIEWAKEKLNLMILTPSELIDVKKKLKKYNRFENELSRANISKERYEKTLEFFNSTEVEQARLFADKIGAKSIVQEGLFWRIYLPNSFELKMNTFLLYISKESSRKILDNVLCENDVVFIISAEKEENNILKIAHNQGNRLVATKIGLISMLLLFKDKVESRKVLVYIFSTCLLNKYLSPYQINSGILNELNFFGRLGIIRDIMMKENANYLIVGARQLGKSSIIKALERRYEENKKVNCYSFTMDDDNIILEMSKALNLRVESSLEEVVSKILSSSEKSIFLIDEADEFIKNEKNNDYRVTKAFRKLSQEGKATFVLTGFWTLYFTITSDYHSPLKNFGEIIKLEGLEYPACRALMIEPMERIGINYENESIIKNVITLCGQRPNLIAIICNEVLKKLNGKTITQKMIDEVIENSTLEDYLKGWGTMSNRPEENQLDRVLIYLTLKEKSFRLTDVVNMLKEKGLELNVHKVKESLERLVLGYLLEEKKKNYTYRIPLFKDKLLEDDIDILLDGDLRTLK